MHEPNESSLASEPKPSASSPVAGDGPDIGPVVAELTKPTKHAELGQVRVYLHPAHLRLVAVEDDGAEVIIERERTITKDAAALVASDASTLTFGFKHGARRITIAANGSERHDLARWLAPVEFELRERAVRSGLVTPVMISIWMGIDLAQVPTALIPTLPLSALIVMFCIPVTLVFGAIGFFWRKTWALAGASTFTMAVFVAATLNSTFDDDFVWATVYFFIGVVSSGFAVARVSGLQSVAKARANDEPRPSDGF